MTTNSEPGELSHFSNEEALLLVEPPPLNQILYGPPGTGKTYATVSAALEILDPIYLDERKTDRVALKARFDSLVIEQRVRFVTFHQSFSYEDFVEGLRATTDEETQELRYEVADGVFKILCNTAEALREPQPPTHLEMTNRRVWKMSLGNTLGSDAHVYDECIASGYVLLGYGKNIDFASCRNKNDIWARYQKGGTDTKNGKNDYSITSVTTFVTQMNKGDIVVVSDGNLKFRAIGEIVSDYFYKPHATLDGYAQCREVRWLRTYTPSLPYSELMDKKFSQQTLYELKDGTVNIERLQQLLNTQEIVDSKNAIQRGPVGNSKYFITYVSDHSIELTKPNGNDISFSMSLINLLITSVLSEKISIEDIRERRVIEKLPARKIEPYIVNGYSNLLAILIDHIVSTRRPSLAPNDHDRAISGARVLIIDEINRGNISRIFGELITLIEPSKRAGAEEALEVILPYSKMPFSVPKNVFLIGTMNSTDRSLMSMDVALRRRFAFREMPPRPDLLDAISVNGIFISDLLRTMNQRIEALLDRDHCIGHAYFMPLKENNSIEKLGEIFKFQILPLLQEYFFDDWQRIQWVLNDHRKTDLATRFIVSDTVDASKLFGEEVNTKQSPLLWRVNATAFHDPQSYLAVLGVQDGK